MKTRLLLVGLCLFLGFSSFSQNAYYDALTLRVYKDSLEKIYPNSSRGGAKRTFFGYLDTKRVMNAKEIRPGFGNFLKETRMEQTCHND